MKDEVTKEQSVDNLLAQIKVSLMGTENAFFCERQDGIRVGPTCENGFETREKTGGFQIRITVEPHP